MMNFHQNENPLRGGNRQGAEGNTKQTSLNFSTTVFKGAKNPRQIRALIALVYRDYVSRENLDRLAGCTNSPDLVSRLRNKGVDIQMREVHTKDRDGRPCWFGEYFLLPDAKAAIQEWLEISGHSEVAQHG